MIPPIFNIVKNMNLNRMFMKEFKKIFNSSEPTETSSVNFRSNEFQSLLRSVNTLSCVTSRERLGNRKKFSLDERRKTNDIYFKRRRSTTANIPKVFQFDRVF